MRVLFRRLALLLAAPLFGGLLFASATAPAQADRVIGQWTDVLRYQLYIAGGYLVYEVRDPDQNRVRERDRLETSKIRCISSYRRGHPAIEIVAMTSYDVSYFDDAWAASDHRTKGSIDTLLPDARTWQAVLNGLRSAFHVPVTDDPKLCIPDSHF